MTSKFKLNSLELLAHNMGGYHIIGLKVIKTVIVRESLLKYFYDFFSSNCKLTWIYYLDTNHTKLNKLKKSKAIMTERL